MGYEWDENKRKSNFKKHGVDFSAVKKFDWGGAFILEDKRKNYGETRYRAMGLIGARVHALVFTLRDKKVRLISLRKANRREEKSYEHKK